MASDADAKDGSVAIREPGDDCRDVDAEETGDVGSAYGMVEVSQETLCRWKTKKPSQPRIAICFQQRQRAQDSRTALWKEAIRTTPEDQETGSEVRKRQEDVSRAEDRGVEGGIQETRR